MSIVEAEEMDEKRGTLRSSEQTSVIFRRAELPESVQRTAENKTQGRERERERIAEKVDFRRAKVCRQKSEREGDREKKRRKRVFGSIGRSATRGLVSGSVDDDLLLYRNLLVFCLTY